ncbi:TPA: bifunctional methylenetetrahydrofolate dehydrogenase/methenyltetrahydrofolate cyclohydrolase [Enterococcus faecalis]|jgi:methylenetetrahydrofolate dehydrogenase (NADP+)/methenyltetrahydrofolate cyclohydrolase|uniref:bifunctional methylenetetrahydrofolate dehydrogenase/methenyltetrahydrofolate cyclohydrolase n=1 Tax=Enterococcus TaxID=1350 RepID=UPI0003544642|nr:bifunctional methylenetetrahydrofolate dehydrogenase/methenyltetrahydrofolate cyclohydrolase [Enterococcus faecalis]EGO6634841.1 bifunctional methylenetetrahydrofolate dehydrogenase/methenyltetrahydrofolate cyclohydrolase [Enterococcus faecalis]EGO8406840.1 bifunctional methylenetetrahydrofolate dehydrogenase/methenyltetrahydrofolate cyclohydrolase [Enterococcus faecalis]EGO8955023.1 bifunctional methylenetetrahydrofolate dehydrogenase/methenyltetrahydrofolate cyclohydrolase [Enterococcus fae
MSTVINGRELADQMQAEIQKDVEKMTQQGIQPGLVVLLVGENPASQTYVRNKERAAAKIGILSKVEKLPETISEEELLAEIDKYNQDSRFHGILVQLPLPKHIDEEKILLAIEPKKDVDGFHPMNLGRLFVGKPEMIPCTPYGIMKMFEAYDIDLTGKRAVVIGRSNIVGKPMAQLLLMKNATVTIAHSKTEHLAEVAKEADILVVAIGRGHFVTKEFVKPGAVVIDVGMNRNQEGKLIGDVAFDEVSEIASYITPVPKGVGPMTITMLMYQTVEAAKKQK